MLINAHTDKKKLEIKNCNFTVAHVWRMPEINAKISQFQLQMVASVCNKILLAFAMLFYQSSGELFWRFVSDQSKNFGESFYYQFRWIHIKYDLIYGPIKKKRVTVVWRVYLHFGVVFRQRKTLRNGTNKNYANEKSFTTYIKLFRWMRSF